MTVRPSRIGHIGMVARDLGRMVRFYEGALGMQISDRMPFPEGSPFHEGVWLRIGTDHHVLSMFGLRDAASPTSGRAPCPGVHHIGFEVGAFDDLHRALRYARDNDVEVQGVRQGGPGCQLRVYLWDPEDNMIELYYAMDQVGWDGATRPYPPVEELDPDSFDLEAWLEWKGPEHKPRAGRAGFASR